MKRPSFQFYPGDWLSNGNLRRCTDAEQGVWVRVLCVLHDQDEYGIVRWTLKELAQAANTTPSVLKSLVKKGVLKGAEAREQAEAFVYVPRSGRKDGMPVTLIAAQDGPLWYSSRLVRDEYVRIARSNVAGIGEDNGGAQSDASKSTPNPSPNPPFGEDIGGGFGPCARGRSSSSSSSSSSSLKTNSVLRTGENPPPAVPTMKEQIWQAGKSLLANAGMNKAQCGTFIGKLIKDYDEPTVLEAVQAGVSEQPADPKSYLKATCQRVAGERKSKGARVPGWWKSDDLAMKQAALVGVGPANPSESRDSWHARIQAAIENGGEPPAPVVVDHVQAVPEPERVPLTPEQKEANRAALFGALRGRPVADVQDVVSNDVPQAPLPQGMATGVSLMSGVLSGINQS
jgi:hypothetical protein